MSKICIIGDFIKDHYVYCTQKVNPENSMPCYVEYKRVVKAGGMGNVVKNFEALKDQVVHYSPYDVCVKERIICDGKYVCRIDKDIINKQKAWLFNLKINWDSFDYIVVSDYNKGAITKELARKLVSSKAKVIVDCKPNHAKWFEGAYLMKPNFKEYKEMKFNRYAKNTLITFGEDGMELYQGSYVSEIDGLRVPVVDVTGAGDTVLATLVHYLAKGKTIKEAAELANIAGAISVQHLGCYAVSEREINKFKKEYIGKTPKIPL